MKIYNKPTSSYISKNFNGSGALIVLDIAELTAFKEMLHELAMHEERDRMGGALSQEAYDMLSYLRENLL